MNLRLKFLLLAFLISFGFQLKASAIEPDITVALDGSGDYTKIQDAINAVPSNQTRRTVIFIKNGLYETEKLIIPTTKKNVTFLGESRDQTIISYHIYDCDNEEFGNKCPSEDVVLWVGDVIRTSATLTIQGEGFKAENLTIQNTAGPVGQALAITVQADKTVFVNCDIKGYQDTIYLWTSGKRSYFENCLVLGRTDYIYGAGIGYFNECEIRSFGSGYITAPSTPKSQPYGFVFNRCDLTYTDGSPKPTDDGGKFALGRPWHEYPKVAILNSSMTDMINPLGWPTTWRMDYAATSADLHLYEYNNTGGGADMSGRADWAGIKELTAEEAANYTLAKVLNGNDAWAPYEEEALASSYNWDNGAADAGWLTSENWNPDGVPANAEIANVDGLTLDADGNTFEADLNLNGNSILNVTANSTVKYLSVNNATIKTDNEVTLSGKIASKAAFNIETSSNFTIDAVFSGVHELSKKGSGTLIIDANNSDFAGKFIVEEGVLVAQSANALGKANVQVNSTGKLEINNDDAFFPKSGLFVKTGAKLVLNATITLSEFYIDDAMQNVASYDASTNPDLIEGDGAIVVGRPSSFAFSGGNWDDINAYTPALLPKAGETVYCEGEMETSSLANKADVIFVDGRGNLRLRGTHTSIGTLTFEGNQRIGYATSGTGFSLEAPIILEGDVRLEMSSGNTDGSAMKLYGSIEGNTELIVKNTQSSTANDSYVFLGGDNSGFTGIWELTTAARNSSGKAGVVGASAAAFGSADIIVGNGNYVQFDHAESTQNNKVEIQANGKAIVNADVTVNSLSINGSMLAAGVYTSSTHPDYIEGTGKITTQTSSANHINDSNIQIKYDNGNIHMNENKSGAQVYSFNGRLILEIPKQTLQLKANLQKGIYIVKFNNGQSKKMLVRN